MPFKTQTIKKAKKQIVKPAKEELLSFKRTAEKQILGPKAGKSEEKESPIVEAMKASGKLVDPNEVQRIRNEMKKRSQILEDEMKKARRQREERDKQRAEEQQQEQVVVQPGEPFVMPASKPSRGMQPGSKPKSPEIRKSKK